MPKQTKKKRKGIEKLASILKPKPCEQCGNPDATYELCPYALDIAGEYIKVWLCTQCYNDRVQDI